MIFHSWTVYVHNVNRVSNSCKTGLKGYDFKEDLMYLGLFFIQNLCKRLCFFEILCTKGNLAKFLIFLQTYVFMQPSMANLNSPSSRVVKDSTPYQRRILRCKKFGKGESSPSLFLDAVNLYLIKFREQWILKNARFIILLFCLFESESCPKINESAWWIFT